MKIFFDDLKLADITLIFKKEDNLDKENYQPINILPHLSEVFERILQQIDNFIDKNCSLYLCSFR